MLLTFLIYLIEHFPKPYTKAEQRLFKIDDSKLSETTDEEDESDDQEEELAVSKHTKIVAAKTSETRQRTLSRAVNDKSKVDFGPKIALKS